MQFYWTMETRSARFGLPDFLFVAGNAACHLQPATQFPNWLTKTASEGALLQICNPTEKNYSPMPISTGNVYSRHAIVAKN